MGQSGKVHAGKCIEAKGSLLMGACSRNDFITKDYDNSAALFVNGVKYRVIEVKFCVGKRICHGLLGTGQHDWLGTILNKIRQSGCGVCHGVGAVQDNKAVVVVVIFDDVAAQAYPIAGTHVGAVDIHGLDKVKRTELIDERNVCNQIFSRYIRSKACCGGDGGNGSPGGNDQKFFHNRTTSRYFANTRQLNYCNRLRSGMARKPRSVTALYFLARRTQELQYIHTCLKQCIRQVSVCEGE